MARWRHACVVAFVGLNSLAIADVEWAPVGNAPFGNWFGQATAYDTHRGVLVLFGGRDLASPLNLNSDTWEWDGVTWTRYTPPVSPAPRVAASMAYDSIRRVTVLFGGDTGTSGYDDTWDWNGTSWTRRFPSSFPEARSQAPMAFDSRRGVCVLFGGALASGPHQDTWEYDGLNWVQRVGTPAPRARWGSTMTYDPTRGRCVMFSGGAFGGPEDADTWEWDGTTWAARNSPRAPRARYGHDLVFDSARGVVTLFGGGYGDPSLHLNDTWDWNGTDWIERTPSSSPSLRAASILYYDDRRSRTVLIGGIHLTVLNDIWTLHDVRLDAAPTTPAPGTTVNLALRSAADSSLIYCAAAALSTTPAIPLPNSRFLALAPDPLFFLSVCSNGPIFEGFGGVLDQNGAASFRLRLPADQALLGLTFHVGALTVGPAGIKGLANVVTLRML